MTGYLKRLLKAWPQPSDPATPDEAGALVPPRIELWLGAIREAYMTLLPLTVLGVMALSLSELPRLMTGSGALPEVGQSWHRALGLLFKTTIGIMGLLGAMMIAARVTFLLDARIHRTSRSILTVSSVAGTTFLLVVLADQAFDFESLGYASVFQSIVVGVVTAELMHGLGRWMPERNDLFNLERSLSLGQALNLSGIAVLSIAIICGAHRLIHLLIVAMGSHWVAGWIPAADSPWHQAQWLNPLFVLINQGLWSLGINGGQFLLHLSSHSEGLIAAPETLYDAQAASLSFLDSYAHLGGAGSTWGLILACLLRGRDPTLRKLAWYSVLPALFNVNELLLFGIPLVLSRTLFLPFILAPLLNCVMAQLSMRYLHLRLEGEAVGWSTTVLLSGYLSSGSWMGVAVQLAGLLCSTLVYAPFLGRLESRRLARFHMHFQSALAELVTASQSSPPCLLERADPVGVVARRLHSDFCADLGTDRVQMAYQPQHDARGRVVGFEALLRWRHATLGLISPAAIVNIAEECELIHAIGRWTLRQAASDLSTWRQMGLTRFVVGINMSPLQLENPDWVGEVDDALRSFRLHSHDIELEITEGQTLSTGLQTERTLTALQAMDIPLSMDDFGMGCTSLLYMHRFKLHSLKLDGNLTRQVLNSPVDQDIIRCVSRLGHSQGAKVIAEFVETAEQKALLEELGCDIFQGWHFSPALPAADIPAYIAHWEAASRPAPAGLTALTA
ncbi:MAG: PTS sugar transporter subunit IIC/EAL domain-containing protein [Curvibacter sp.]|nr:PTS sugar transporter subunit IIC/EAL domain-containing protein [Curvibacter sp.]